MTHNKREEWIMQQYNMANILTWYGNIMAKFIIYTLLYIIIYII